jgi:hypothetical protein
VVFFGLERAEATGELKEKSGGTSMVRLQLVLVFMRAKRIDVG